MGVRAIGVGRLGWTAIYQYGTAQLYRAVVQAAVCIAAHSKTETAIWSHSRNLAAQLSNEST